jgi:hypothetical protein
MKQIFKALNTLLLLLTLIGLTGCRIGELSFGVVMDSAPASSSKSTLPASTPALDTQSPDPTPQLTGSPNPIPTEIATVTPVANNGQGCYNLAEFVEDLSVPDGKTFEPGEIFLKSWRLRNAGSCTWNQEYTYVHIGGNLLGAYESQPIASTVLPGELLDLTIGMTAPDLPGLYLSEWMLRDAGGNTFGVGSDGTAPISVRINVVLGSANGKATPYADTPAAGICAEFEGEIVTMTINPDMPDPRCIIVKPDQRLRVVNNLESEIQASLGSLSSSIVPDDDYTFEKTFGELLLPGVHSLGVTPCCGGSIWLK